MFLNSSSRSNVHCMSQTESTDAVFSHFIQGSICKICLCAYVTFAFSSDKVLTSLILSLRSRRLMLQHLMLSRSRKEPLKNAQVSILAPL